MSKIALVHFGNEESYGLLYVAEELKKHGDIKFFDAEMDEQVTNNIISYSPDYLCFSPMTTFYQKAKQIEADVKAKIDVVSVFGGHHATNCGEDCGDITVRGSVHGVDLTQRGIVDGGCTDPINLKEPAREEYYRDIPRMRDRYRKVMLSVTGCPWSCTYCSSSSKVTQKIYGSTIKHLTHRDLGDIMLEADYIRRCTHEIEWVDDDVFFGDQEWLEAFFKRWQVEIGLPMYVSTTSLSALKARPRLLTLMRESVNVIGLGVQAINPSSLKILGREWDSEEMVSYAYKYLTSFGFKVNLQAIVGLPVKDPVADALETVRGIQRIGPGSVCSIYPLQVYPGTPMSDYCKEHVFFLNDDVSGDTNTGLPGINFGDITNNRIRNICKLATMVVKYNINLDWLVSMLDIDVADASKDMSLVRYYECIKDRLPDKADQIYQDIIRTTNVRY